MFKPWLRLLPFLFLAGVLVVFFLPYANGSQIPYAGDFTGSDLTELNVPFRAVAAESIRSGHLPLITDLLAAGFPLLAEGQTGALYPFNVLTFTSLPLPLAITFGILLHLLLAATFTYWYARSLGVSRPGATLSALAFCLSGFFVFRLKHLNLINAAIWLPLALYLIEKYRAVRLSPSARGRGVSSVRFLLLLSLVFALQFLAGHPQISYITALVTFMYFLFRAPAIAGKKPLALVLETAGAWVLVGLVTLSLVAIQLLPSYEFFSASSRTQLTGYGTAVEFAFHPAQLLTLLNPYTFGNPAAGSYRQDIRDFGVFWESNLYVGLLPLLLALFAFRKRLRTDRVLQTFAVIIAFCLAIALGRYNPLFFWFWKLVPGLSLFRFPQRFILPIMLVLTVAAGMGFDLFAERFKVWASRRPALKRSPLVVVALPVFVLLVTAIDLFYYDLAYLGVMPATYLTEPASARFIKQDAQPLRIFSFQWPESWRQAYNLSDGWDHNPELYFEHRELLAPNLNALWGIAAVDERGWLEGGQLAKFLAELQWGMKGKFISVNPQTGTYVFDGQFQRLLGMQNVKYVLSFFPITGEGLTLKKEINQPFLPPLKIYENAYVLPRAYAVFDARAIADPPPALDALFDSSFDFSKSIVLEKPLPMPTDPEKGSATVSTISLEPQRNEFAVTFSAPGLLFVSNAFLPGWFAEVDGQPAEILRANYAFSAVFVEAGDHVVQFYFKPQSLAIGMMISLMGGSIALLAFMLLTIISFGKKTKP